MEIYKFEITSIYNFSYKNTSKNYVSRNSTYAQKTSLDYKLFKT